MKADPVAVALDVDGVEAACFTLPRISKKPCRGVVSTARQELDVRKDGQVWNVNDDLGRNFRSRSLRWALRRAVRAEREMP